MNEMEELIARHFDGELDDEGAARLREWLAADRENLKRFLREAHLHGALPTAARGDALVQLVRTAPERKVIRFPRKLAVPLAIAAGIALLASLAAVWMTQRRAEPRIAGGAAEIVRAGRIVAETRLRAGDEVRTTGAGSAQIVWRDETTWVRLGADSALRIEADAQGKRLFLTRGVLEAQVEKQRPGHPMIIATEHGRVEVLGTRFSVRTAERKMRVTVTTGRVLLSFADGGAGSIVAAGHAGDIAAGGAVAVGALSVAESLDGGLLAHWPLAEGLGGTARDVSGAGRDATIRYPNWIREGARAAVAFSDDTMPAHGQRTAIVTPALHLPPQFTIALRLRSDSRSPRSQVVFTNAPIHADGDGFSLFINYNEPNKPTFPSSDAQSLVFRASDGRGEPQMVAAPQVLATGEWHAVVVKVDRDAGFVDVLVDGRAVLAQAAIPRGFALAAPLWFGAAPSSTQPLGGSVRDIRIYERLLAPEEVAHLSRP